jgi:hypothetical protein
MWWKVALRVAVAVGLDKWAKKKAGELIAKAKNKAKMKIEGLEAVQKLVTAPPTARFRSTDGGEYEVCVVKRC